MIAEEHHFYQYIGRNVWIQRSHLVRYYGRSGRRLDCHKNSSPLRRTLKEILSA